MSKPGNLGQNADTGGDDHARRVQRSETGSARTSRWTSAQGWCGVLQTQVSNRRATAVRRAGGRFHPGRRETAGERCPAIAPRGWMRQFRARSSTMAESRNCYVPLRPAITGSQTAPIHLTPASSRIRRSPRPHKATNRRSSLHFRLGSNVNSQLMVKKPNKNNDTILRLRAG